MHVVGHEAIRVQVTLMLRCQLSQLREEYRAEIDLTLLASEGVVDDVVQPAALRSALIERFAAIRNRPDDALPPKKHGVLPV